MDPSMNELDRLAVLDPARGREPSEAEWIRSRAAVDRIVAGPRRRPARRWALVGGGAAVAGAAAAVLVPALLPGTAERAVAAWTAVPSARTGEQVLPQARACARNGVGGSAATVQPADVLLAEQRGVATLLIMRKAGTVVECLSVGDDALAAMGLAGDGPLPPVAAGTVTLETMSSLGSGKHMWSNIVGLVGPGVTGVDVRLDNGRVVRASVKAGWWAAWWPGPEGGEVDHLTVLVHTGGGTRGYRQTELP
ncbi:hypothetical protein [Dactylosporangium sp. CA-092794]|uniref:hypothetical protein n=1 Tax=Dactylosporangium sp. CA-092794 TaxID=3239929 RepID=UPI003D8FEF74